MLLLTVGNHEEGKTDVYVCVSDRSVLLPKHNYITFLSSSVIKENKWSTTTQLLFFFCVCVCCLFTSNFRVVKDKERKGKKRGHKSRRRSSIRVFPLVSYWQTAGHPATPGKRIPHLLTSSFSSAHHFHCALLFFWLMTMIAFSVIVVITALPKDE